MYTRLGFASTAQCGCIYTLKLEGLFVQLSNQDMFWHCTFLRKTFDVSVFAFGPIWDAQSEQRCYGSKLVVPPFGETAPCLSCQVLFGPKQYT